MRLYIFAFFILFISCQKAVERPQQTTATTTQTHTYTWANALDKSFPQISAHRGGGYYTGYPENAIETFEYVHEQTRAIIECDIELTKDSVLILMHDNTLDRTTTATGKVNAKTWEELKDVQLKDLEGNTTNYKIPTLTQTLAWAKPKKVFFTLDIKRGVPFEMVVNEIRKQDYFNYGAIITYSIKDAQTIHQLAPEAYLSVAIRNEAELERVMNSGIDLSKVIAFTGTNFDGSCFEC